MRRKTTNCFKIFRVPKYRILIFCLIVRLGLVCGAANQFFTVRELCGDPFKKQHIRTIEGAVLTSVGDRKTNCVITFQTDTVLQRFMLRFEKLKLDCNDHLYVYDGAYTTNAFKADLSCRNTLQNVRTIYTHSNYVTLKYTSDQWGPPTNGFRLLITAFKDKQNTCQHFRCQTTNFCIDQGLTCDDINHCGDGSDESHTVAQCPSKPFTDMLGLSGALLVTLIISMALFCCICSLAVTICVYRQRRGAARPPALQLSPASSYPRTIFLLRPVSDNKSFIGEHQR